MGIGLILTGFVWMASLAILASGAGLLYAFFICIGGIPFIGFALKKKEEQEKEEEQPSQEDFYRHTHEHDHRQPAFQTH